MVFSWGPGPREEGSDIVFESLSLIKESFFVAGC